MGIQQLYSAIIYGFFRDLYETALVSGTDEDIEDAERDLKTFEEQDIIVFPKKYWTD